MTATGKILNNIGIIQTFIANFPMSIFDVDGKRYTSSIEFLLDVLRACGFTNEAIVNFLITYFFEINGDAERYTLDVTLLETIARGDLTPQKGFITNVIEPGVKAILMGILTSLFTCSALPILPNRVFDRTDFNVNGNYVMPQNIAILTSENGSNDFNYKVKIPVASIDVMGLLSISPVSKYGRLYYNVSGTTKYYKKTEVTETRLIDEYTTFEPGETYTVSAYTYENQIKLIFSADSINNLNWYFKLEPNNHTIKNDIKIQLKVKDVINNKYNKHIFTFTSNTNESNKINLNPLNLNLSDIRINGSKGGGEITIDNDKEAWLYCDESSFDTWRNTVDFLVNGTPSITVLGGGINIPNTSYGKENDETKLVEETALSTITTHYVIEKEFITFKYDKIDYMPEHYVTYAYLPENNAISKDSPDYIGVYQGQNPNLLYSTQDMNAFIWYVLNRGKRTNQIEKNHLMWDNRRIANREAGTDYFPNSNWYSSKKQEGDDFRIVYSLQPGITITGSHINNAKEYPILQIERYDDYQQNELLLRFPAQRYFAPKKRRKMEDGEVADGIYFNASIYKFNWEYLQSIELFYPKFILARLIENFTGLALSTSQLGLNNFTLKIIRAKLAKAIKNIITADDMEVEDCYMTFSNEDFDELLNAMFFEKYTATEYKGESVKARKHNMDNYAVMLDSVNDSAMPTGTISRVQKLVTDVMVDDTNEENIFEWGIDDNLVDRFIASLVMPIIECFLTPQVMLLFGINFNLLGLTKDNEDLLSALMQNLLSMVKQIVKFIKDKIIEALLTIVYNNLLPMLEAYAALLWFERLTDWLVVLTDAVKCIGLMTFNVGVGQIDEVNYADIVNNNMLPENQSNC